MSHRAKPVEIHGIEYASITLAAGALGLEADTVRRRVHSTLSTWSDWKVKGETKAANQPRSTRKVRIKGKEYPSVQDAAKALGLTYNATYARIVSESVEFHDYEFVDPHPTRISHRTRHIGVQIGEQHYRTLGLAAHAEGVTPHGLRNRMRHHHGSVHYVHQLTGEIIA